MEFIAPNKLKGGIGRLIQMKRQELDSLTKAYDAFSAIIGSPDDMPSKPVGPQFDENGKKIDGRRRNGGNSTKAKDPSKDGRRNNGRKKGTVVKRGRKRATVKA